MKRTNTAKWMEKQQRWQINVQKDGVRKSFYSGTPGRTGQREANRKADLWLDEGVENQKIKVCDAYEEYLKKVKATTSYSNYRPIEGRYRNYVFPLIGARSVSSLCDADLQSVIDTAFKRKKLSKKTLMNLRGDLTGFVKYCRKQKLSSYVPEGLVIPSAAKKSEKAILQPEDLQKLFQVETTLCQGKIVKDKYINAYRFQVLTGLRPGELMGLKPCDYKGGVLSIHRAVNAYGDITEGKNKNARRAVPLSDIAKAVLEEQLSAEATNEFIFGISSGDDYKKKLARYCKQNGIPVVTPYELRHTFVSVVKILPEGVIKPFVGHSEDMDTYKTYAHAISGEEKRTAEIIGDAFKSIINP